MRAALLIPLLLAACEPPPTGPRPMYEPGSEELFDAPWPTDARVLDDGTIDVTGFPNPNELPLVDRYIGVAAEQGGYGTNSPIYLRFNGRIDESRLPTPAESQLEDSALVLVDIDPDSPHWGERFPVRWHFQTTETVYQPENLLAVAPLWGFPLRPDTTYALVVTTRLTRPNARFLEVFEPDHPQHALYAPLAEALTFQGLSIDDVAIATVFTTMDPLADMRVMAQYIRDAIEPAAFNPIVNDRISNERFRAFDTHYPGPLFQHGERPYAFQGGEFRFDERGAPILAGWDDMRIRICTPPDLSDPPPDGWPVVIYQHGTGGDYRGFCNGNRDLEVGAQLARDGLVGIGIDQPLHGNRATEGTDTELHSFNVLNPDSARTNFRQGALDAIYLAHALSSQEVRFTTEGGETLSLDPDRISFMGHSQGGLTGALAIPFFGDTIDSAVLSGAGGGLAITVVERKDPLDFAELLGNALQFGANEEVTELHPIAGMLQWLVESTAPINSAPYWSSQRGGWSLQTPTPVVLTSGLEDVQTSYRTAEALAAAARMPILFPQRTTPDAFVLRAMRDRHGPLQGNAVTWEGEPITMAFSQWESDHFVIFDDPVAARMYRHFLSTTAEGAPVVTLNP